MKTELYLTSKKGFGSWEKRTLKHINSDEENFPLIENEKFYSPDQSASLIRNHIIDEAQEEEMIKFIKLTIAGFFLLLFWCFGKYNNGENWVS